MLKVFMFFSSLLTSLTITAQFTPDPQESFYFHCVNEQQRDIYQHNRVVSQTLESINEGKLTLIYYRNFTRAIRNGEIKSMDGSVISRYNQIRTTEKVYISDNVFVENSIVKQTNTHPGGKTFNSQRRIESHYKKENSGKIVLLKQIVDGVEQSLEGIISSTIQDGDVTIISHERNKPVRTDFNGGYVIVNYQKNICHQSANPLVSSERN